MPPRPPSDGNLFSKDNVIKVDFSRPLKENKEASNPSISGNNLQKLKIFSELLKQGVTTIVLDATLVEVNVPAIFKETLNLRLNFSHRYGLKDFVYDDWGIKATLSFSEGFYFCMIPWQAVFIVELDGTHMGAIWSEDVPDVLKPAFESERELSPKPSKDPPPPFLRLVTDDKNK